MLVIRFPTASPVHLGTIFRRAREINVKKIFFAWLVLQMYLSFLCVFRKVAKVEDGCLVETASCLVETGIREVAVAPFVCIYHTHTQALRSFTGGRYHVRFPWREESTGDLCCLSILTLGLFTNTSKAHP